MNIHQTIPDKKGTAIFRGSFVLFRGELQLQITLHQNLQKFIAVNFADQCTGVIMIGDIGGIFGQDISHDLVNGIVPFFTQSLIYGGKNVMSLFILFLCRVKLSGIFVHAGTTLLLVYLYYNLFFRLCKEENIVLFSTQSSTKTLGKALENGIGTILDLT